MLGWCNSEIVLERFCTSIFGISGMTLDLEDFQFRWGFFEELFLCGYLKGQGQQSIEVKNSVFNQMNAGKLVCSFLKGIERMPTHFLFPFKKYDIICTFLEGNERLPKQCLFSLKI